MAPVTTLTTLVLKTLAAVLPGWTASRSRQQPSADPFVLLVATLALRAVCSFGAAVPGWRP